MSVVTPVFNGAAHIRESVESVLRQDYPCIEQIVVDGGSTDGTVDILRDYGRRYPDRFRWVSEPDNGQSDALNKGFRMARGEFIGWQNADDYYLPHVFAEPIQYLIAHPEVALVYSSSLIVDDAGETTDLWAAHTYDYRRLLFECFIPTQSTFMRRDALLACGGVDEQLHFSMDYDLWLRMGLRYAMAQLPGVRGAWRRDAAVKTVRGWVLSCLEAMRSMERVVLDPSFPPHLRVQGQAALRHHILYALLVALAFDRMDLAGEVLRTLRRHDPTLASWPHFCVQVVALRLAPRLLFVMPAGLLPAVPGRSLALLRAADPAAVLATRQTAALAAFFRAVDAATARERLPYLLRALQVDAATVLRLSATAALLRLFQGRRLDRLLGAVWAAHLLRERLRG